MHLYLYHMLRSIINPFALVVAWLDWCLMIMVYWTAFFIYICVWILAAEGREPRWVGWTGEHELGAAVLSAYGIVGEFPGSGVTEWARLCTVGPGAPHTTGELRDYFYRMHIIFAYLHIYALHLHSILTHLLTQRFMKLLFHCKKCLCRVYFWLYLSWMFNFLGAKICRSFLLSWTPKTKCAGLPGTAVCLKISLL